MSAFAQFCLVALALYLWESALWLPLRGVILRRRKSGWAASRPDRWLALRENGLVPLPPLWTATGLAPCQAPPLAVDPAGRWLLETSDGRWLPIAPPDWPELVVDHHHLAVGKLRTLLSSPRVLERLRRARARGLSPARAVELDWRLALSPVRAAREWRRWNLVRGPLAWLPRLLTWGFLAGLPLAYLYMDTLRLLLVLAWLWSIMLMIAAHLWWLGRRVYPAARGPLRMNALLSALVPFHAMRAAELAAVHACGATHPAALILARPAGPAPAWLGGFVRSTRHLRPRMPEDTVFATAVAAPLAAALAGAGLDPAAFDTPPAAVDDPDSTTYCPRCHARFTAAVTACGDCRGLPLRPLPGPPARKI